MAATEIVVFLVLAIVFQYHLVTAQICTDFVESTTCGGNIVADSGIIRYNHTGYGNNTGCMWLIRSNINSKIEVRLLEDSFSSSSQYIHIYGLSLDGEISGNADSDIRHGGFKARHFNGPLILVTFTTLDYWGPVNPTPRFTLLFRGCGPDISNPPTFTHHYREKIPGETEIITYPEDGGIYPNNQLITYLGLRQDRAVVKNSEGEWKVKVTYQDIQSSAYCMFGDSLRFYSAGFNFLCAVDEQDEFIWRFCEQNSTKTHVLPKRSPKYGNTYPDNIAILAVFQSNGYQGGKGFVFEW
ncbi:uncharacterized protein LOC119082045 [Bradysia coprophila]|uniref:uncharacterized protein LOC119082045 n=1 Tax=Bradysia coprophila TaxID=38358 RepID=UPI00187DBAE7|nr:uncharacterized protein LOC119082045 [Bradysia coprophila]